MSIFRPLQHINRWINNGIRHRLIFWSLLFWIISLSIISLTFLWTGQREMSNEANQRNIELASVISRDVNAQVGNIYSDVRTFSQYLGSLGPDLTNQAKAILALRLSSPQRYRAVYYFNNQNALLFSLTDNTASLLSIKDPADIITRPVITVNSEITRTYRSVQMTGINISDVSFTELDRIPIFYIGMPVTFSTGETRIIILEIDLNDLWQRINLSTIGQSGITYAVSRTGIIIAHPEPKYIGYKISSEITPVLSGQEGSKIYLELLTNREVLAAYSPVGGSTGWGIVVEQDLAEVNAPILRTGFYIMGAWLLLGTIGTFGILVMIRNFTRPIVELTKTTQNISQTGDLKTISLKPRSDEMGHLGQSFNLMVGRLQTIEKQLVSSEEKYRSIVENSQSGIFIVDNSYRFTYANNKLCEILGYPLPEIIGSDFRKFLNEESKQLVADRYLRRQKGEDISPRYEFRIVRKDGEIRDAEISSSIFRDMTGQVTTVGQILDVTDRKRSLEELRKAHDELEYRVQERTAELTQTNALLEKEITQRELTQVALRQNEEKYRHLVESTSTIILEMDTNGNISFLNKFGQEFFGFSEAEIIGKNVIGTIVPPYDSAGRDLKEMIRDITVNPQTYAHNENENMRRNGERVWIVWRNQPHYNSNGKLLNILCVGIDRTHQKKNEELLAQQAQERVATEERNRLARDLHDAVSQTLFSASLISEVLPHLWERNQVEGKKRLEEVRQLTRGALAEMRTLLFELRPAALADAELGDLLKHLAASITGRARVPVSVEINGQCYLEPEAKVIFYRIAQEALNNVAKHAAAQQAKINLTCTEEQIILKISDDGKGFEQKHITLNSLGIGIMRERAAQIGAELQVKSAMGTGTEITLIWHNNNRKKGNYESAN